MGYYFIQDNEGKFPERWQLSRDVEEVSEQAVGLPRGRGRRNNKCKSPERNLLDMLLNVKGVL